MQKKKFVVPLVISVLSIFIFALPKQVHAEMGGSVVVTPETFDDYFTCEGSANWLVNQSKIQLTNTTSQFGSFHLKDRISPNSHFELEGKIQLGEKLDSQGGGDGIGFAFYPGKVGSLGFTGGGLGIAGIPNAVGFKFDTYYNKFMLPSDDPKQTEIGKLGIEDDWTGSDPTGKAESEGSLNKPFGGFLTTDSTGYGHNEIKSNWELPKDTFLFNKAPEVPIKFIYDGTTLTIALGENGSIHKWHRPITGYSDSLAFHVSASTGGNYNNQYFIFKSFVFNPVKKITVKEEWKGDDDVVAARPTTTGFTVVKTIDGVEQTDHYDVSVDMDWTKIIDDLPEYTEDNKKIEYSIKADEVDGYTTVVEKTPSANAGGGNSGGSENKGDTGDEEWVVTHTYNGALTLETVPEVLNWTGRTIPRPGTTLSRDDANEMTIAVKDTRLKETSNWKVDAKVVVDENLPNNNFKLFSLLWKNADGDEAVELDGQKVLDNTAEASGKIYSKTWSIDNGVLLKANDYIPIGEYKDNVIIRWTLTNAADPESTSTQEQTPSQDVEGGEQ